MWYLVGILVSLGLGLGVGLWVAHHRQRYVPFFQRSPEQEKLYRHKQREWLANRKVLEAKVLSGKIPTAVAKAQLLYLQGLAILEVEARNNNFKRRSLWPF